MSGKVTGEDGSSSDLAAFQVSNEVIAGERSGLTYGNWESEPSGVGVGCWFGEHEEFVEVFDPFVEPIEVMEAAFEECVEFGELRDTDSCLHIGRFEVIADVGVGVFVVVSAGEFTMLLGESPAARVIFTRFTPTISAPISERFHDLVPGWAIC